MTPERLVEIRERAHLWDELPNPDWALVHELLAEIDALTRQWNERFTLRKGEMRCACCAGSGKLRHPEPGEMVDI